MIPPEPGPDPPEPPTPTPTYNDWEYLSTTTFGGNTVYVDVGSASDSFVGVVTVGFDGSANWYSDGSLIKIGDKYYPFSDESPPAGYSAIYYNYDDNTLKGYLNGQWQNWKWVSATPFDQVPADFVTYLKTGNFTLVQG